MKKTLLSLIVLAASTIPALAVDDNTVEITYSGNSATISIASNISSYVTVNSGSSSHVKIAQSATFTGINPTVDNEDGEIIYVLKGTSTDGEFYLEGSFKCTVQLNALTLTNPSGPAINIQNGKRVEVTLKKGTTSTLADGANDNYNGCYHSKGHTEFKGKGTLNIVGNSRHAIYSKEYIEVKNSTINITAAQKDGIHCKEYFLMESGTLKINGVLDDGIQVELDGKTSTGTIADHEDEDSGNFYMEDGTLSITNYGGKAIKADGTITYSGGKQNFDTADTQTFAGVNLPNTELIAASAIYDLNGRPVNGTPTRSGIYFVRRNGQVVKMMVR